MVKPQFMKSRVVIAVTGMLLCVLAISAPPAPKALSSYDPQVKELLAQMTLDEKIGQMTQPEQNALKDPADIENYFVGSLLSGGRFRPQGRQQPRRPGPTSTTACRRAPQNTRLQDPDPLRHRRRARPQQRARRGGLPAQHRARLHAQSRSWSSRCERITAEEVRATGIQWAFAPVRHRPAGHPLGPHLRRLLRGSRSWCSELGEAAVRGLQGTGPGESARRCWPAPSTTSATAARRSAPRKAARASTRATRASTRPRCAASTCRATSRRSRPASAPSCRRTAAGTA